jgi:hypothetical protein
MIGVGPGRGRTMAAIQALWSVYYLVPVGVIPASCSRGGSFLRLVS